MNAAMKELTKQKESFLLEEKNTKLFKKIEDAREKTLKRKITIKTKEGKKIVVTATITAIALTSVLSNVNLNKDVKLYGQEKQVVVTENEEKKEEEVKKATIKVVEEKMASSMYAPIKDVEYAENEKSELVFSKFENKHVHSPVEGEVIGVDENSILLNSKQNKVILIEGVKTDKKIGEEVNPLQIIGKSEKELKMTIKNEEGKNLKGVKNAISEELTKNAKYGNFVNLEKPELKVASDEKIIRLEEKEKIKEIINAMPQKYKESSVVRNLEVPSLRVAKALAETSESFYYDGLLKPHLLEHLEVGEMKPEVKKVADMIMAELKEQDQNPEFSSMKYKPTHFYETLVLLMKHESGEIPEILAKDPMQSSAYAYGEMGKMFDPQFSVESGVECFLTYAKELGVLQGESDIRVAFQAYNYGKGYYKEVKHFDSTFNLSEIKEVSVKLRAEKIARGNKPQVVSTEFRDKDQKYAYGDYTYAALVMKKFDFGMSNEELAKIDEKEIEKIVAKEKIESVKALSQLTKEENNIDEKKENKEVNNATFSKEEIYVNIQDTFQVELENQKINIEDLNFDNVKEKEAVQIVKELKKDSNYKKVKNDFLELTLKKLDSKELNEYLTGNYENKRLDFLTENALAIAGLEEMPKELKEVLDSEKEGKKFTEVEGQKFQVNAKVDIAYIENLKKEFKEIYNSVTMPFPNADLTGLTIGLDYGHAIKEGKYSQDPGAVSVLGDAVTGSSKNLSEANKAYELGKKFKKFLESMGATVIESQPDGKHQYKVDERSTYLNNQGVDMIISVHFNGNGDPKKNYGMVALGSDAKPQDYSLGEKIIKHQNKALPNVEVSNYKREESSIGIVRASKAKLGAVVLEAGFITSVEGAMLANSEVAQTSLINGWVSAIAEQYGVLNNTETPEAAKKMYKNHLEEMATKMNKDAKDLIHKDDKLKEEFFKLTKENIEKDSEEEVFETKPSEEVEGEETTEENEPKENTEDKNETEEILDDDILEQALSYFN